MVVLDLKHQSIEELRDLAPNYDPRYTVIFFEAATWRPNEELMPAFMAGDFALPAEIEGKILIHSEDNYIFPPVAGHMESVGRCDYIDGASSSLLMVPQMKGDPCLNHIHIPANTKQSKHTHPNYRKGLVVRGGGTAFHRTGVDNLRPGFGFRLPANEIHHFETKNESLDVLVYHPTSCWGPTNESHQMLDATNLV